MSSALREIRLYGVLGAKFGRVHHLAVESVAEAMQALRVILPGFEDHLLKHSRPGYRVWAGRHALDREQLTDPVGGAEVIRVAPVVAGSKRQGVGNIIIGAVLVVVGYAISTLSHGWASPVGSYIAKIGVVMMVGGAIQAISPQRNGDDATTTANQASYAFGGPVNVTDEGGPVPLLYGRLTVGSTVISGGISTVEYTQAAAGSTFDVQTLPVEQPLDPLAAGL